MVTPAAVLMGLSQEPALDRMAVTYTLTLWGSFEAVNSQLHKTSSGRLT